MSSFCFAIAVFDGLEGDHPQKNNKMGPDLGKLWFATGVIWALRAQKSKKHLKVSSGASRAWGSETVQNSKEGYWGRSKRGRGK